MVLLVFWFKGDCHVEHYKTVGVGLDGSFEADSLAESGSIACLVHPACCGIVLHLEKDALVFLRDCRSHLAPFKPKVVEDPVEFAF